MSKISIFTDGGSRGNPGPSAYGFVIKKDEKDLHKEGKVLGITTNNVAEYNGVLASLTWLENHREHLLHVSEINFFMDSLLLCQQLKGIYKIKKPHLVAIMHKIRETEGELGVHFTYTHVYREKNKEADAMVNIALDSATGE